MNANPMLGRLLAKYHHILDDIIAINTSDGHIEVHLNNEKFHEHFNNYVGEDRGDSYFNHKLTYDDGIVKFVALEKRQ